MLHKKQQNATKHLTFSISAEFTVFGDVLARLLIDFVQNQLFIVVYDSSEIWFQGCSAYQTAVDVLLCEQFRCGFAFTEPPYWIRIAAAVASS